MKINRRLAGKVAQRSGANFENLLSSTCQYHGIECIRIPDGCKQIAANKLIRVKTPFDFILRFESKIAFIDTKSTMSALPYSMLKNHQLHYLDRLSAAATCGLIIYFKKQDLITFIDVKKIMHLLCSNLSGSIHHETDGIIELGSFYSFDPRLIF